MHGCYAQTELGHGSNIAGLETTATFDETTDEFIMNTPSVTAFKFWPGELGKFATHAVVFAKLFVNEKDHGVQSFLVQIRDTETHHLLPGVIAGDIGPKYGFSMKDNGYLAMNHIRIPRFNMLSRYSEIDSKGNFTTKGDLKILYTVMQSIRILIIRMAYTQLSRGLTIAIRYGIVRTQFKDKAGSNEERAIIDYQTHQFKLIPLLCQCYAFVFVNKRMQKDFSKMKKQIKQGDLSKIGELHTISSGTKAFYTWMALDGLEVCRQS
jgi:acyl-CoA oxidase